MKKTLLMVGFALASQLSFGADTVRVNSFTEHFYAANGNALNGS